jgi:hypothetical protein
MAAAGDDPKVVDFAAAHDRKHGPEQQHVYRDDLGVKWFEFTCEFKYGESSFGFSIWALDAADAQRRMECLRATATVCGQVYATIGN